MALKAIYPDTVVTSNLGTDDHYLGFHLLEPLDVRVIHVLAGNEDPSS